MSEPAIEANFDGLVGPTHHYAGLSVGNLASEAHRYQVSRPRQAAREGLAKMKRLMDLGVVQGVLPPQPRPNFAALCRLGFTGSVAEILARAKREAPNLLHAATSASSMWAANAATVSPGFDTADRRVHFTAANLISQFHRALETAHTAALLRAVFADPRHFAHHQPLPATWRFADEGGANHMRLAPAHGQPGIELFVFGYDPDSPNGPRPRRFAPRQSRVACQAVARLHQLDPRHTLFVAQHPEAIDAGVFHNDVIAVSHTNLLMYHQYAFADADRALGRVRRRYHRLTGRELITIEVSQQEVPLQTAVATYLFNSQIVTTARGKRRLLCPTECRDDPDVGQFVHNLMSTGGPIDEVAFVSVRQSMHNGGGPACLRLRVVLSEAQLAAVHPGVLLDEPLYERLVNWIDRHYRPTLSIDDLADPALGRESAAALHELMYEILELGELRPEPNEQAEL